MKYQLELQYDIQGAAVRMIGVWDTVGSLGIPGRLFELLNEKKYGFLDTALHPCVAECVSRRIHRRAARAV